jgi:hypothetical protein
MNKEHPAIKKFIEVGRLVNEWRDTLSYGVLTIATVWDLAHGGKTADYLHVAVTREVVRGLCWSFSKEQLPVGGFNDPIDNQKFSRSAFAGFWVLGSVQDILNNGYPAATMGFILSTLCVSSAGGLQEVGASYNTMWDWPRKKNGGGTTQTQKLKDGIRNLAGTIGKKIGGLTPQPATVPVALCNLTHKFTL